jgi:hypothetical protein
MCLQAEEDLQRLQQATRDGTKRAEADAARSSAQLEVLRADLERRQQRIDAADRQLAEVCWQR